MSDAATKRTILIAGATASGKSALAVAIAERVGGTVVNADSMQVYRELPILTAQPTAAERRRAPHRLYGHVSAREAYSTGRYLKDLAGVLDEIGREGRTAVIVGGTGLYLRAMLEGLSPVPPIAAAIRDDWRRRAGEMTAAALHEELANRDPVMAERLDAADRQRVTRALEVIEATGVSLARWQEQAGTGLIDAERAIKLVVERSREALHQRTDQRFDMMMAEGMLDEVRALRAAGLAADLPAMRALGVAPLMAHLNGAMALDAAVAQAKLETRQYVKRQQTWLKRNMIAWIRVYTQQTEKIDTLIGSII